MARPRTRPHPIANRRYFPAQLWPETKVLVDLLIANGEGKFYTEILHNAVLHLSTKHLDDPEEFIHSALAKLADRYDVMGNFK